MRHGFGLYFGQFSDNLDAFFPTIWTHSALHFTVTGALWKVSTEENIDRLVDMGLVPTLIRLLIDNSDALDDLQFNPLKINVLTNVVGAIAESARSQVLTSDTSGSDYKIGTKSR